MRRKGGAAESRDNLAAVGNLRDTVLSGEKPVRRLVPHTPSDG